jgi:hypothetical protein
MSGRGLLNPSGLTRIAYAPGEIAACIGFLPIIHKSEIQLNTRQRPDIQATPRSILSGVMNAHTLVLKSPPAVAGNYLEWCSFRRLDL